MGRVIRTGDHRLEITDTGKRKSGRDGELVLWRWTTHLGRTHTRWIYEYRTREEIIAQCNAAAAKAVLGWTPASDRLTAVVVT